ncbi:MAG TPA: hypothetical protein VMB48_10460, partial [Steroidobacteraceae bacterium]|nr:hypothetical protein [Steroidobacteraceae bacterium]
VGALYGVFRFLRLLQTDRSIARLDITSRPRIERRVLDHWDNLDGSVERGYAGASLWDWQKLPGYLDPRYTDYARACASVGINGSVLNNVNADARILTPLYLQKVAALAGVLRRYGIRTYLSVPFAAPMLLGGLPSADPESAQVRAWWRNKVDEIYRAIPDFGGLLVKANSEGQSGPADYGRTHAQGANMIAAALAPHGGIVMWRAFVYSNKVAEDRAMQAYTEFVPLDGKFSANVLLQVKNGPIDFQPREPFHPLFGAMPHTSLMLEVQLTKEYLGMATHLVYLGPLIEEVLRSDTYMRGPGSTVARVIDGSLARSPPAGSSASGPLPAGSPPGRPVTGMAGVANVGADRNWTGSQFNQANWYAFGRLAWDPGADARDIAEDWVRMTFSNDPAVVAPVVDMMMGSREAAVDYMMPLGLHHIMARGHHYGPGPWVTGGPRADWTATYFHHAGPDGIGFDRTATGSNAVSQYAPPLAAEFADPARTPEKFLLWFHHLPWDYRMASGRTLWDELVLHYDHGVAAVAAMRRTWAALAGRIDAQRYAEVSAFLAIQEHEARWWRDACVSYFQSFSHRPLPPGSPPPKHPLAWYEALCFPYVPGNPGGPVPCGPGTPRELPAPDLQ